MKKYRWMVGATLLLFIGWLFNKAITGEIIANVNGCEITVETTWTFPHNVESGDSIFVFFDKWGKCHYCSDCKVVSGKITSYEWSSKSNTFAYGQFIRNL